MMVRVTLTLAILVIGSSSSALATATRPAVEASAILDKLPEGLTRTIFERLPPSQQRALGAAALREVQLIEQGNLDVPAPRADVGARIERAIALRAGLLFAASDAKSRVSLTGSNHLFSSADLVTAAYAERTTQTAVGQRVLAQEVESKLRDLLLQSPYIWRPRTPCSETPVRDPDRLPTCVERQGFKSVVGLAWPAAGKLEIWCTGQLISRTMVITADHCLDGRTANPIVLTHFTGGGDIAVRKADGRAVSGVRRHSVHAVWRGKTVSASNNLRGYDIAILELQQSVAFTGFPALSNALPDPAQMTVAGWGGSDVDAVNGVGLEVTVVTPRGSKPLRKVEPSMLAWSASQVGGGGICRADSGGPIYAGFPTATGAAGLKLIGLVAGGNENCKSGDQVITDLTRRETIEFMCRLTPGNPYCA
jgi:hypothetical protein